MVGERYREMEILTASPEALVAKLYEGAVRFCRSALEHDRAGRHRERSQAIGRALAIVGELQNGLDHERGGAIARNLDALYLFAGERLLEGNCSDGARALEEALRVLQELEGGWQELAAGRAAAGEGEP